jgi:signal transduction histidine kinase
VRVRWYKSLYFRIACTFVVAVAGVLLAQGVVFNAALERGATGPRPPNTLVAIVAADVSAALSQDSSLDLPGYLTREYGSLQPIYVVMKSGGIAANRAAPLDPTVRDQVRATLDGGPPPSETRNSGPPTPFVTAPLQVNGVLRGIVVLPPATPPGPLTRDLQRFLSLPGTLVLALVAFAAAIVVFEPARRRLMALQDASRRLGAGDLTARAPVRGTDEITDLATTFNAMAERLAAREQALRTADHLRRQLLADVSHELKTPLTAIRGYVETLRDRADAIDRNEQHRYYGVLERETLRLERIVRDLVDVARLENGVGELDVRVFAARRVFEHIVERHHDEVAHRAISVHVDVDDGADQIVADAGRIEQVFENLFTNALRHTPDGGTIAFCATCDGASWLLRLTDSGSGIPPEHLPYVFDRLYKADRARTSVSGGSGLGLSIARAIVEAHGGRIVVESAPGRTVFTVRLPKEGTSYSANR